MWPKHPTLARDFGLGEHPETQADSAAPVDFRSLPWQVFWRELNSAILNCNTKHKIRSVRRVGPRHAKLS
jgi:hypothetical protein